MCIYHRGKIFFVNLTEELTKPYLESNQYQCIEHDIKTNRIFSCELNLKELRFLGFFEVGDHMGSVLFEHN